MIPTGPLSDDEKVIANLLAQCTMIPGSWQKKFAGDINNSTIHLSARQRWYLHYLVHRYRKQTGKKAGEYAAAFIRRYPHCPEKEKPKKKNPDPEPLKIELKENNSDNQLKLF